MLIALCLVCVALAASSGAGRWSRPAAMASCGAGSALALSSLALSSPALASLVLGIPARLELAGLTLVLDGLSAFLLLAVFVAGAAQLAAGVAGARMVAAAAAVLLAGDTLTALLAFGLLCGALAWRGPRFWVPVAAWLGLLLALMLLGGPEQYIRFALIRTAPPDGLRGAAILLLSLGAVWPLVWQGGAVGLAGQYLLSRLVLDLCGAATPVWWGVPVLAMGLATALHGGWAALAARHLDRVAEQAGRATGGLAICGLGVALAMRGADQPALAALAGTAALVMALNQALSGGLLLGSAAEAMRAAGGAGLDRLGGLRRVMPGTAAAYLAGTASLALLPPFAGFAGFWLLAQALLGAVRVTAPMLFVGALAALGLAAGLLGAGVIRGFGLGFLGGPRSSRAASARDRLALPMLASAALLVLFGLFPMIGIALADPALRALTASAPVSQRILLVMSGTDGPVYAPVAIAVLLAAIAGLLILALQLLRGPAPRLVPAWDGGLGAPADDGGVAYAPAVLAGLVPALAWRLPGRRVWIAATAFMLLILIVLGALR